jgi:hypothetical protein
LHLAQLTQSIWLSQAVQVAAVQLLVVVAVQVEC